MHFRPLHDRVVARDELLIMKESDILGVIEARAELKQAA